MEEQLQLALTELLSGALAAKDFLVTETPLVIQELLMWKFTWALIMGITWLTFLVAFTYGFVRIRRWSTSEDFDWDEAPDAPLAVAGYFLISLGILVCMPTTFAYFKEALMIAIAPKIYLIEYAASLVK